MVDKPDARRVELPEAEDVVESSGNSTTSHVCNVASGANETRRFAGSSQWAEDRIWNHRCFAQRAWKTHTQRLSSSIFTR